MSEPLHKATPLLGIRAFICVVNSSATQQQASAAAVFRANATSRARLPDEGWLTDADLNILENEAHAPGRRGGWSRGEARRGVEKHWDCKQRAVRQRADEKRERSKAEKQPPRRHVAALHEQNRRSLPLIWISIQLQPQKRRQRGPTDTAKRNLESRIWCSSVGSCDSDQCSKQDSDENGPRSLIWGHIGPGVSLWTGRAVLMRDYIGAWLSLTEAVAIKGHR